MKLLVIGAGGVGSYFIEQLSELIEPENKIEIDIADGDLVEPTQVEPVQNYTIRDVGNNKALSCAVRFGHNAITQRIKTSQQLNPYDFIVCCADNEPTRKLVITHCFAHNYKGSKEFLILRATGRNASAFPKLETMDDNMKFVDMEDKTEYSCQAGPHFNLGHKIAATIGVQMLLNYMRGLKNTPINIRI